MKNLIWKTMPMLGALVLTASIESIKANPLKIPEPDPGLLAAVDVQANRLEEGIVSGDFEVWYPGLYPAYRWTRAITEIGSNGLYRVDYTIFHSNDRRRVVCRELSLLLFRPGSRSGGGRSGFTRPARSPGSPGSQATRFGQRDAGAPASSLAVSVIEDALVAARMFMANWSYYRFFGDSQGVSLVSRLPDSFPGTERFGGAEVRRVSFHLRTDRHGGSDLIMEHAPLLLDTGRVEPYRTVLAEDVSLWHLQYWDAQTGGWVEQWNTPYSLPTMVQVTLGLGKIRGRAGVPNQLVSRIVALPTTSVPAIFQGPPTLPPPLTNPPPGSLTNSGPRHATAPESSPVASAPVTGRSETSFMRQQRRISPLETPRILEPRIEAMNRVGTDSTPSLLFQRKTGTEWNRSLPSGKNGSWRFPKPYPHRHRTHDVELEWLGRSGVELARYVLAMDVITPFDSFRNRWAGGPGLPSNPAADIPLEDFRLREGRIAVRIEDTERKFNINVADEEILHQALSLTGVDAFAQPVMVDSILDWRDRDSNARPNGAESDYYLHLWPPYVAKNGPLDDLSELLWVNGVTPTVYYGVSDARFGSSSTVGLADLFTPVSIGKVNFNTASASVLQLMPGIDSVTAQRIINLRAGPDGVEGTADDGLPSPQALLTMIPTLNTPSVIATLNQYFGVRSMVFEVNVDVELRGRTSHLVALLVRVGVAHIRVLSMDWE